MNRIVFRGGIRLSVLCGLAWVCSCTALPPPRLCQAGAIKMPLFLSCSFLSPL